MRENMTSSDVKDILDFDGTGVMGQSSEVSIKDIFGSDQKKKPKKTTEPVFKRPEGMHRELYALLYSDKNDPPPLIPSDSNTGYKQVKAKLGIKKVRPWKFMPFTNPARKDGFIFNHWRRVADEGKDYQFARFNKQVQVPMYSDQEYHLHLHDEKWTKLATDHLFDLCGRFDFRWFVIHDRFDSHSHSKRSIEDMKERYYNIVNKLAKVRADPSLSSRAPLVFDAEHERKRKDQLIKLFERTPEQVEEEEQLIQELKKIELRKKEREKKAQDLQKLITAADNSADARRAEKAFKKKKMHAVPSKRSKDHESGSSKNPEIAGIKFPDFKQAGASLRSQRMKLPSSVGQKKMKAIEISLDDLGVPVYPMPTTEIAIQYNELRSDIVLLYELKLAKANIDFELQTLRHRLEALAQGKDIGPEMTALMQSTSLTITSLAEPTAGDSLTSGKKISEMIDVDVVSTTPLTPRKRRAAIELNLIKKLKR
ncbi:DNA methyltransferase 1-associated protein 1-like [Anneissia japonica]|uniref:DNA methyltransferase 1-associated protein 1-like n=1 Tax=Anneissia japonica TaxID=1529436 RepID=UPI0014258419|nr:DNA methyltransferase 1-associated protein 1-like [Anneissia japonica]